MSLTKVGVLLSGRGSNFLALQEACRRGDVPAEIVVVVSNKADAKGLERARELGIHAVAVPQKGLKRSAHEAKIVEVLREAQVEWVCLAGYMRLLTPLLIGAYPQRILNIHPSLLPAFPGLDAQRQAWEHGVRVAGCTVHLVDEHLDNGPIVVQRMVAVEEGESADELSARILREEHQAYAQALKRLLVEPWCIEGRRLCFVD